MATAANLGSCSVGVQKGEVCHKIFYCGVQELKNTTEQNRIIYFPNNKLLTSYIFKCLVYMKYV